LSDVGVWVAGVDSREELGLSPDSDIVEFGVGEPVSWCSRRGSLASVKWRRRCSPGEKVSCCSFALALFWYDLLWVILLEDRDGG
jgi:hypothetical protein